MNFSKIVKSRFLEIISQMEENKEHFVKNPGKDFSRDRKLGFSKTILLILCMEAQSLKKEILKFFNFSQEAPSVSAFCQQRAKIKTSAFYYLISCMDIYFQKKTYKGHRLVACDGSDISLPLEQGNKIYDCRKRKNQKDYFQMHANAMYDLVNRRYLDVTTEPSKKHNERKAFLEMFGRGDFQPGTIFVMDRGYEGYGIAGTLHFKGMYYVIRAKDGSIGGLVRGFGFPCRGEFDKTLSRIFTFRDNEMVRSHPEVYHRIHRSSPAEAFLDETHPYREMPVRILRIMTAPGIYECIITNLPSGEFPAEEIKKIYKMRWGIETSFRELKYAVGLSCLHSKKEEYIIQEILARIVLYNFCEIITSHVTITQKKRKHIYQINYTMAVFLCRKFLRMPAGVSHMDVETLISMELLPVRPGRSYRRNMRAHPAVSFLYRVN